MTDKKVAVVVHGIADHQPSDSARQIANLLTDLANRQALCAPISRRFVFSLTRKVPQFWKEKTWAATASNACAAYWTDR